MTVPYGSQTESLWDCNYRRQDLGLSVKTLLIPDTLPESCILIVRVIDDGTHGA